MVDGQDTQAELQAGQFAGGTQAGDSAQGEPAGVRTDLKTLIPRTTPSKEYLNGLVYAASCPRVLLKKQINLFGISTVDSHMRSGKHRQNTVTVFIRLGPKEHVRGLTLLR